MERNYFVHQSSYVDEPCEIGEGTRIWHFSHVMAGSKIGRLCNIGLDAAERSLAAGGTPIEL